jgi:lysophospholipase L1-like esterase
MITAAVPYALRVALTRSIVGLLAAVAILLGVAPAAVAPAAVASTDSSAASCAAHWVGSWAASPSDASLLSPTLVGQTVRMIVAPHLGGDILRVHLSNRFGSLPVTVGPVTVGVQSSGPSLVPGSERSVTFSQQTFVTIPAGGEVVSDPVTLSFAAFQDLAVSIAAQGIVLAATEHHYTRQTSYLTPPLSGNHAADTSGSAFTQTTTTGSSSTGWYFLDGIDVMAPGSVGAVVAFGDSITDGYQGTGGSDNTEDLSTINTNGRWPDDLARRLIAAKIPLSVLNAGIAGNELLYTGSGVTGPGGLSRFGVDALAQAGVTDVIQAEGINDIGGGRSASQVIGADEQLIAQAHAAGVHIQLATLLPAGGPIGLDAAANAVRDQVNQWIRTQQLSDGVVDFDAALRDPNDPSEINPPLVSGDGIHPDLAGYQAMANAVNLALLAHPQCSVAAPPVARVRVSALRSAAHTRPRFLVRWSASDTGGAGTAYFTVQVESIGPHRGSRRRVPRWQTLRRFAKTTKTSLRFTGHIGDRYKFRVSATDTSGMAGGWATTRTV